MIPLSWKRISRFGLLTIVQVAFILSIPTPRFIADAEVIHINGKDYELGEWDLGIQWGCMPEARTVVRLTDSTGRELWTSQPVQQARKEWLVGGQCVPGGEVNRVVGVWEEAGWVQFFVETGYVGAGLGPVKVTGHRFDGVRVKELFQKTEYGLELDITPPMVTAVYFLWEDGECRACPHRWVKEVFRAREVGYVLVYTLVSHTKTTDPPWPFE